MSQSFESAMTLARMIMAECDMPLLDRLQDAHDHELEQVRKSRFHEGYVAGQHSMDAEHAAVALRLRRLPLDGDTQENLSQIARAIWHSDFGWTEGACSALRDELVRLMGGVREQSPIVNCGNPYGPGDAVLDAGIITSYDVLGNERHKAVCRLREIHTDAGGFVKALAKALGVEWQAPRVTQTLSEVRDRLIHLLGGDEPTAMEYIQRIVREHDRKCLDMELSGAELSQASVEAMSRRADQSHESSPMSLENETGITDELRECVETARKSHDRCISEAELLEIADRIDEQFDRICQQHEDVLQSTIDTMVDEHRMSSRAIDERAVNLANQRNEARNALIERNLEYFKLLDDYNDMKDERDELRAKLEEADAAIANWREREKSFDASERLREELRKERDELRERLDRVAAALRGVECGTMSAWEAAESVRGSSN